MGADVLVEGAVDDGWGGVRDAFVANFAERGEVGAAVCVYVDGHPVVDLWVGVADPVAGSPWQQETIVCVFSSTKGVTAIGANLAIQRGLLDPDAAVASYWPEFGANGKDSITVRQVLGHQAGLPLVDGEFSLEEALDCLEEDHEFMLKGDVFSEDLIETFVDYKRKNEADAIRLRPHPYEFALYYDI